jgi:hypothetical protein
MISVITVGSKGDQRFDPLTELNTSPWDFVEDNFSLRMIQFCVYSWHMQPVSGQNSCEMECSSGRRKEKAL